MTKQTIRDPEALRSLLREQAYLADRGLATALYLALDLGKPLLLEGEAGVGKTEVAKALSAATGRRLIRLQCYEGIDASQALYEWNYTRQLLHIRALGESHLKGAPDRRIQEEGTTVEELFGPEFLVERPLLAAVRAGADAILLIDEIDRADDEFEAFLLEVLSDFAVTIPEVGTITASEPPTVILTSNRTRELHDALKRRCLYHWIDYPAPDREAEIVRARAPEIPDELARRVSAAVSRLRELMLTKTPGIAETIDWARAVAALGDDGLTEQRVLETLGAVVKDHDDVARVRAAIADVVSDA